MKVLVRDGILDWEGFMSMHIWLFIGFWFFQVAGLRPQVLADHWMQNSRFLSCGHRLPHDNLLPLLELNHTSYILSVLRCLVD